MELSDSSIATASTGVPVMGYVIHSRVNITLDITESITTAYFRWVAREESFYLK